MKYRGHCKAHSQSAGIFLNNLITFVTNTIYKAIIIKKNIVDNNGESKGYSIKSDKFIFNYSYFLNFFCYFLDFNFSSKHEMRPTPARLFSVGASNT